MTLHEIEKTLQTLISRNKDLTEEKLKTLLQAGGWEENTIEEGLFLFKNFNRAKSIGVLDVGNLQKEKTIKDNSVKEENKELALLENSGGYIYPVAFQKKEIIKEEPVYSLIEEGIEKVKENSNEEIDEIKDQKSSEEVMMQELSEDSSDKEAFEFSKELDKEPIPHNLPLRPFETSTLHVPFYKYRKLFTKGSIIEDKKVNYVSESEDKAKEKISVDVGNEKEINKEYLVEQVELDNNENLTLKSDSLPKNEVINNQNLTEIDPKYEKDHHENEIVESKTNTDGPPIQSDKSSIAHIDTKLILVTAGMLITILLLLGYMYSNGRL